MRAPCCARLLMYGAAGLPSYMIEAAKAELAAGHLDLSDLSVTSDRGTGGHGTRTIGRQVQPQIALDPYGQGVHVLLPAVSEMPAGVARCYRWASKGKDQLSSAR